MYLLSTVEVDFLPDTLFNKNEGKILSTHYFLTRKRSRTCVCHKNLQNRFQSGCSLITIPITVNITVTVTVTAMWNKDNIAMPSVSMENPQSFVSNKEVLLCVIDAALEILNEDDQVDANTTLVDGIFQATNQ